MHVILISMIRDLDVQKLSSLSRISVSAEELTSISKEISSILEYVGQIDKAVSGNSPTVHHALTNVLREDVNPHERGINTEAILNDAPEREGNYLKVKKILG